MLQLVGVELLLTTSCGVFIVYSIKVHHILFVDIFTTKFPHWGSIKVYLISSYVLYVKFELAE